MVLIQFFLPLLLQVVAQGEIMVLLAFQLDEMVDQEVVLQEQILDQGLVEQETHHL